MADTLPELDRLLLVRAMKDSKAKVAALKNRLKDEFQHAEAESREPFPITPLTSIRADLVLWACDAASAKADKIVSAIIGNQRNSCKTLGDAEVFLLSEQLLPLLVAAGVVEEPNAKV